MSEIEFHPNKKSTEIKVGIFAFAAIFIIIIGYSWFTGFLQKGKFTEIKVRFERAGNIETGSPVSIFGVKKGKVKKIEVLKDGILAHLQVKLDFPLMEGTEFLIHDTDIMGGVVLEIIPGEGEQPLDLRKIQRGNKVLGIENLIVELNRLSVGLSGVFDKIDNFASLWENLQSLVDSSQKTVTNINSAVLQNSDKIAEIMNNMEIVSSSITRMLQRNEGTIDSSLQVLPELFSELKKSLIRINKISEDFEKVSEKMSQNDGSLQLLISERELYDNLLKSSAALDSLLSDIKRNPKKYFKVKVF